MKTPTLETDRLYIRPIRLSDAEDFYSYAKDPSVGPLAGWEPHHSLEMTRQIIYNMIHFKHAYEPANMVLVLKETGKMIGTIELFHFTNRFRKCDLGYSLNPLYHNQGLITEAAKKMIEYGFKTLELDTIAASMFPDNLASQHVAMNLGMECLGLTYNSYINYDGTIHDKINYEITKEKYNLIYNKEEL